MAFVKGQRVDGQGGKREGAGRPPKEKTQVRKTAELIARAYIEKHIKPVLEAYLQLAKGRPVNHYNQKTGELLYTEIEVDPSILRHYIDRILPARAPEDKDGKTPGLVVIETNMKS